MDISLSLSNISKPTKSFSSQDINSAKRKVHLAHIKLECVREEVSLMIGFPLLYHQQYQTNFFKNLTGNLVTILIFQF